jgi:hypothetical protein
VIDIVGRFAYRPAMSLFRSTVIALLVSSGWAAEARADGDDAPDPVVAAIAAANQDAISPVLKSAEGHGRAIATGTVAWNGAADHTAVDLAGEVKVLGPLRLVLRVDNVFDTARPGIGAAVQFLSEQKHGVSSSAYFVYKAEGFTEAEGELEGLVALSKQLGPLRGTLNLAYGQDPEGRERDGEIALGVHVEPLRGIIAGVVGRYRDALGSNGDKGTGVLRDALAGVTGTVVVGRVGVTATAGYAAVKTVTSGSMIGGGQAAVAVGAVF